MSSTDVTLVAFFFFSCLEEGLNENNLFDLSERNSVT